MREEFILEFIPKRIKQLGYTTYHIRHKDLTIQTNTSLKISAYTNLYFIVDEPQGLIVESDYGLYDTTGDYIAENTHQHKGEIIITNPDSENKRIKLIQVVIVN